ncbi:MULTISPECIES: DUF7716 domain-containing protein [Enterobacter]|uniref:DUF7716 domain-containing protein n=1 Tax=Enterobacter roggenkampii TaxID=1812935 RepID=A0ABD4R1E0_9ENTR|nr:MULTISPECIES: hypothetical protein [Enterobacter]CAE6229192.1 hypothetical protein AI2704V1_1118 [Enterobacter cloacae]EPY94816.1 hypothetical protein L799_19980 [Enterobacter roggenkampii EC_38VIM1]KTK02204.1 hypothetical protein ASU70_05660 [Enterobacter roggenkampii]MBT1871832.1 hypothetical protein [Enterobacter mori]MBU3754912.1 hypothetical protein [Enterobacter roggenkampii]
MNRLEYRKAYGLDGLIYKIMGGCTLDNFCVYTKEYEAFAKEKLVCYLDNYPVISDDDEELYPDFVVENSLELFFYGEQFIDVLHNISIQREKPSVEDFISGLNFYLENDNFIEL